MKETIKKRIDDLRGIMRSRKMDAYIIYGTDPHLSEYLPEYWQTRSFISGFTGSAGIVVISSKKAALWTDSRYFLQAEEQLFGTGIELVKMRTPGFPEPDEWLSMNLGKAARVGVDEWCISANQFKQLETKLLHSSISLIKTGDYLAEIWDNRPPLPDLPIFEHEAKFACTDRTTKIESIKTELQNQHADLQIISMLDDLAWTFNLRGSDVECNPVFLGYAAVSQSESIIFVDSVKLNEEIRSKLQAEGIQLLPYSQFESFLKQIPAQSRVLFDRDRTNQAILSRIPSTCQIISGLSIPCQLKAIKSSEEIENIRQAMRKDGVAMLHFLHWLENHIGKTEITEYQIAEKLIECRTNQPEYKGISFFPIVGYKEHGAIVHFHVSPGNALKLNPEGFLLVDSGAQYSDGTTDITRTIALSELSATQKSDFTLVLKGMISLTLAKFPVNTRGYHLDILARKDMWKHGLNYGHGTGHGVGYFLNVHEGPMSIRQEFNDRVIEAGMVMSNEPALYRLGEYGLRTENMMVCIEDESTEFGDFLKFDTLTLCPIDTRAIEKSLLNQEEIDWLNEYHQRVYQELKPLLNHEMRLFLKKLTASI